MIPNVLSIPHVEADSRRSIQPQPTPRPGCALPNLSQSRSSRVKFRRSTDVHPIPSILVVASSSSWSSMSRSMRILACQSTWNGRLSISSGSDCLENPRREVYSANNHASPVSQPARTMGRIRAREHGSVETRAHVRVRTRGHARVRFGVRARAGASCRAHGRVRARSRFHANAACSFTGVESASCSDSVWNLLLALTLS